MDEDDDEYNFFLNELTKNYDIDMYVDNTTERNLTDLSGGMRFFDDRIIDSRVKHKPTFENHQEGDENINQSLDPISQY
jgi:hypothetical protein